MMKQITKSEGRKIVPGENGRVLLRLKKNTGLLFLFHFLILVTHTRGQSGNCSPNTPFFNVNLSADPNATWTSNPPVVRKGNCCGTSSPDVCIEFQITLNAAAVAINFEIASGAIPPGAMFYQINCGPSVPVGSMICISGAGPHTLTFCKPGNNQNTYRITSIGGPTVSPAQTTGDGCSTKAWINGVNESTITWREITSGTNAFSSYLNCTSGCDTVTATPQAGHPAFVDYVVCGTPTAQCYPATTFCDTVRINFLSPIQNTIQPDPPSYCINTPGVTLTGNINGGLAPYVINWTNSSGVIVGTANSYFASSPGAYSMIVYDATYPRCPAKTTSTNVTVHPMPVVNAGQDTTICATNAAVQLNGSVTNATGGIWSSTGSGVFFPSNAALNAVYTASASDIANGSVILALTSTGNGSCNAVTDQMKITIAPQIFVNVPLPVVCYGKAGSLTASASGGLSPYTYAWNTGSTSQTINNVFPGTYNITVSDAIPHGCKATQSVTVTQNPQINITAPFNNLISCDTSVTISVSANGGTGTLNYLWNTGATTTSVNVPGGTYIVTVTDANMCAEKDTITISAANSVLTASVNHPANLCYGATTTLQASATGGFGNYTFSWNNNATGNSITAGAGTYCVIAKDEQGCLNQVCVTVTQSPLLSVSIPAPQIICNGSAATIHANVSGGLAPYNYSWNTGEMSSSVTRSAGSYTVTVTDSNFPACPATASVTITQASPLIVTGSSYMVSCAGGNNGAATATCSGSVGPYNYLWPYNNATSPTNFGLTAGTYAVNVTDAIGCSQSIAVTVTQPTALGASVTGKNNVSCFGGTNGSAVVAASGGTAGYSYLWSPYGGTSSSASGLNAETYTITVTDSKGCVTTANTTITQPSQLTGTVTGITNVSCYAGSNGNASVAASGGAGNFSYYWNETGGTNAIENGLGAGTYSVTITDASGCMTNTSVTITSPPILTGNASNVTSASCYGGSNGSAMISASGGTPNYNFFWPSQNFYGAAISNLAAGTYAYTVTDANNCSFANSIIITQPSQLTVISSAFTSASCKGSCNGTAGFAVSGGVGPYSYQWNSGQTTPNISQLCAGSYTATISDSHNCIASTTFTITEPPQITSSISLTSNVTCYGGNDGNLSVSVSGGTPNYSYNWLPGNGSGNTRSGLPAGNYTVTATDAKGCTHSDSVTITQPAQLIASPANVNHVSCFGGNDGSAAVNASGGTGGYTHHWLPNNATTPSVSNLSSGTYTVNVTDSLGCISSASIVITQPQQLTAAASSLTDVSCSGGTNGAVTIAASGGTPLYNCYWPSLNSYGSAASSLQAGTYSYSITDLNGCTFSSSVIIAEPPSLGFSVTSGFDATCYQSCNGMAVIVPSGGVIPFSYHWSNGQTTPNINNLCAGTYSVTITDNNGCMKDTSVIINQPSPVIVNATSSAANCFHADGSATANASGGTAGYSYSWNTTPVQFNNTATALIPGNYIVTATDNHGCTGRDTITVANAPGVAASISNVNNTSCSNICNGELTVTGVGGTGPYTYSWNTSPVQNGVTATFLCEGTYTVTVTDAHSCVSTTSAAITSPSPVVLASVPAATVICNGQSASLSVSASGGTGNFVYSWDNGTHIGQTYIVAPSSTTVYTVVAIDSNNCISEPQTISVTINPPLIATVAPSLTVCPGATVYMTVSAARGNGNYNYNWSPGNYSGTVYSQIPPASMTYSVIVTDGCSSDTGFVNVVVNPLPAINFSSDLTSGCAPLCINFVNNTTVSNGDAIVAWDWNFGDNDSSSLINPQHCFKQSGAFNVTLAAETALGCRISHTFSDYALVLPSPVAAFTCTPQLVTATNATIYFTENATGENSWSWNFGDSGDSCTKQNPFHSYKEEGNYCIVLTVSNEYNCKDTATHCLDVQPEYTFYIPNAFTPNGNEKNEFFTGKGQNIKEYQMIIFDRWGNLIFETHDLAVPWDGKVKGEKDLVEEDVYVYKVNILDVFDEKHEYIGHVTVLK